MPLPSFLPPPLFVLNGTPVSGRRKHVHGICMECVRLRSVSRPAGVDSREVLTQYGFWSFLVRCRSPGHCRLALARLSPIFGPDGSYTVRVSVGGVASVYSENRNA